MGGTPCHKVIAVDRKYQKLNINAFTLEHCYHKWWKCREERSSSYQVGQESVQVQDLLFTAEQSICWRHWQRL